MAHEGGVYAMAWVDRETLVTGGRDGHLRFWKFADGKLTQESAIPAHNFAIYDIAMHPGGKYFATASRDKTIKIWPVEDLKHPLRIAREGKVGHTHSVNRVVWIGDGGMLASAGDDKKIRVWEVEF
jgi:WD40 repeat protein